MDIFQIWKNLQAIHAFLFRRVGWSEAGGRAERVDLGVRLDGTQPLRLGERARVHGYVLDVRLQQEPAAAEFKKTI